jgi:hypothetical protein
MRLARPSDKAVLARVIDARCDWMQARELPSWRGARDDMVAHSAPTPRRKGGSILDGEAAGVIGQTVVQRLLDQFREALPQAGVARVLGQAAGGAQRILRTRPRIGRSSSGRADPRFGHGFLDPTCLLDVNG